MAGAGGGEIAGVAVVAEVAGGVDSLEDGDGTSTAGVRGACRRL
jgi:hypothetical protein